MALQDLLGKLENAGEPRWPTPLYSVRRPTLIGAGRRGAGLFHAPGEAFSVEFDPSVAIIQKEFREFAQSLELRSWRTALKEAIQTVMAPSFQKNFDVGGRPTWIPLSEYTVKVKGHGRPLIRKGVLRRVAGQLNIWTIEGQKGRAFVRGMPPRAWYGNIHQSGLGGGIADLADRGSAGIPARPFIVAQKEDADAVQAIFDKHVQKRIDQLQLRSRGKR